MKYSIVCDEKKLEEFLDFLPTLTDDECFYFCLLARSKYSSIHIPSNDSQIKRFVVTKNENIYDKLRQLEIEQGLYKTKNKIIVPQEALALYVNSNPRSQSKALTSCMKRFIDIIDSKGKAYNIQNEALSAIKKSKSRTYVVDFDVDFNEDNCLSLEEVKQYLSSVINENAYKILITRGGCHILVYPEKVNQNFQKTWYLNLSSISDKSGDNMIPVAGCTQGGFIPYFD